MIGTDFIGRLGNQLFIYAFTRSLIERRQVKNERLLFNFKRSSAGSIEDGFCDSLQYFNVIPYETTTKDLILRYGSLWQKLAYLFYMFCSHVPFIITNDKVMKYIDCYMEKFNLFFTGAADKARPISSLKYDNVFIRGYFADRANFDAIRPILLSELTPIYAPLEHNKCLYEAASKENSVCISIRRGDYLNDKYKKNFYVCDENYFFHAIELIKKKIKDPIFIFFSDDIQWVREHFHDDDLPYFYESGNDPVWEKLRLMYSCHHFIISNSTFSWWAQYLGRREDKIVISPSSWYANPQWSSNLIDENFITIN